MAGPALGWDAITGHPFCSLCWCPGAVPSHLTPCRSALDKGAGLKSLCVSIPIFTLHLWLILWGGAFFPARFSGYLPDLEF